MTTTGHISESGIPQTQPESRRFAAFAWFTLAFNLFVVAIGVLVRATGSGDGCGSHWPTCNGATIPVPESIHTVIEFSHRISTALDGLIVLALTGWGIAKFRRAPNRFFVIVPLILLLLMMAAEALVGRHLVVRGLVTTNDTQERAVWMAVHLVTTFLLLFSIAAVAWFGSGRKTLELRTQGAVGWMIAIGALLLFAVGVSGAITALGDTIFPVANHEEALALARDPRSHFLLRLRIWHPFLAMGVGMYLVLLASLLNHLRPSRTMWLAMLGVGGVLTMEMLLGYLNVLLRAPVWMQVAHLLVADLLWIAFVFLGLAALAHGVPHIERVADENMPPIDAPHATVWDYIGLTKPKVISLLLVTTITAMFIAATPEHPVTWPLLIAVFLGGYLSAGAAKVFNMVIDADLDRLMKRTSTRPTADNRIPPSRALGFALFLTIASVVILWAFANALASLLAFAGLVFYVVVYTLLLKRRTYQNIVIGGAAGAFPPLVGWAAVTDGLSPLAWYLFAIIFLWTPAHFWALAMLLKDDYAEAGVPMLPVVRSARVTTMQIAAYAVLTAIVSFLPVVQGFVGWGYALAALLLNGVFLDYTLRLWRNPERKQASALFHYSMLYLALLFTAMAVDRSLFHI